MSRYFVSTTAGIVILCATLFGSAAAGWDPIQQLTTGAENSTLPSRNRSCAAWGDYVHLAFAGKPAGTEVVLYMRSTDRGASWESPVFLDSVTFGGRFGLAVDGSGVVHFVNCRKYTTNMYYRRSTDNGSTWSTPQLLKTPYSDPYIAAGAGAQAFVLDVSASGDRLELMRTTNSGATWSGPTELFSGDAKSDARIVAAAAGWTYATWRQNVSAAPQVFSARSTDDGVSWSSPFQVTDYDSGAASLSSCADRHSGAVIAYSCNRADDYVYSSDGGVTWSTPRALPWTGYALNAVLSDEYDGLHALSIVDQNRVMHFRSAVGAVGWSDTTEVSGFSPGAIRQDPMLAIDDYLNLHAFWVGRESGKKQVYYRRGLGVGGIDDAGRFTRPGTLVYPCPATAGVFLRAHAPGRLITSSGRQSGLLHPGWNDLSDLPRGVYFVLLPNRTSSVIVKE